MNGAAGIVSIVGAGPGDPELITVRGRDRLAAAEVVIHDDLVGSAVLSYCPPACQRIYAGKRCGRRAALQARITELMIFHAHAGRRVVRLKGGDSFVFGRGGEELAALVRAGVPCEVVPGVTAATAAAAAAGVPLTQRGIASAVVFLTGHESHDTAGARLDWAAYARLGATLCLYMGTRNLADIAGQLVAGGMAIDMPVALVSRASWPDQQVRSLALGDLLAGAPEEMETPGLAIIGEVARAPAAAVELASLAALSA
jgi:uroporphyrin-III C-methyltransferase